MTSEAGRLRSLADAHRREGEAALRRAQAHERGDVGEARVRRLLEHLEPDGWRAFHSRHWPGTRRADLDHLLVGPAGVVVLDSKHWRGRVRMTGGRLLQGQDDVTDQVDGVRRQVEAVEEVLADEGLSPLHVTGALVFVDQDMTLCHAGRVHLLGDDLLLAWLRALPRVLEPADIDYLADALDVLVPPLDPADRPVVPAVRPLPRPRAPEPSEGLFDVAALDLAELERAWQLPPERWMVYLHPAQLEVVRRRYSGPSRVRGPAGCGKTVVALHRAAYLLGQEPGDLLFASYVRTLPVVLERLYARLSPLTVDRVHFSGVHRLAARVLREAGVPSRLDPTAAETAFNRAWTQVGRDHLETPRLRRDYWFDEVQSVIKGRALHSFEEYAALSRVGRRTPLSAEQRRRVWDLYVRYEELLDARGTRDFADTLALALEVAERGDAPSYRFAVVDEVQDLDLLSLRLVAALVSDERDGLTVVGDGQQAVYAGGCTLKEAGIAVTGRSTVLAVNYRNTRQIVAEASAVVAGDDYDDVEEGATAGEEQPEVVREGRAVLSVRADDADAADAALVRQLQEDNASGLGLEGAAVLCHTRAEATRVLALLRRHRLPVLDLEEYTGEPVEAVKVGTTKRAKGLEFPRVYLPRTDAYLIGEGDAESERVRRERRELFVAMTRARDGLWRCRVEPPAGA